MSEITLVADSLGKFQINEAYRPIAEALIKKYPELNHIPHRAVIFGDNYSSKGKSGGRRTLARVSKMPAVEQDIIHQLTGKVYEYKITFLRTNTETLSAKQVIALMYHELRHIAPDGKLVGHDIEDFSNMVRTLGPNWAAENREIPDLLDSKFQWEGISAMLLDFSKPGDESEEAEDDLAAAR